MSADFDYDRAMEAVAATDVDGMKIITLANMVVAGEEVRNHYNGDHVNQNLTATEITRNQKIALEQKKPKAPGFAKGNKAASKKSKKKNKKVFDAEKKTLKQEFAEHKSTFIKQKGLDCVQFLTWKELSHLFSIVKSGRNIAEHSSEKRQKSVHESIGERAIRHSSIYQQIDDQQFWVSTFEQMGTYIIAQSQ